MSRPPRGEGLGFYVCPPCFRNHLLRLLIHPLLWTASRLARMQRQEWVEIGEVMWQGVDVTQVLGEEERVH